MLAVIASMILRWRSGSCAINADWSSTLVLVSPGRERDLRGPHDRSVLVDPDRERRVGHAEELDQHVRGVDQRRMRGMRGVVERACRLDVSVERDRDDLDAGRCQLFVQRLPPGQVEAAPSP